MSEHGTSVEPEALGWLVDHAHLAAPDDVATLVRKAAAMLGGQDAVTFLVDYGQRTLLPLPVEGARTENPLDIEGTLGGHAYRTIDTLAAACQGGHRLWVPLLNGTTRVGLFAVTVGQDDDVTRRRFRRLAGLTAELIASKNLYGDAFRLARRTEQLTLAAEMQWNLLPPLTFSNGRVVISGGLEPSYTVAGDTFDYAFNHDIAHVAIIDAMGHGFEATMMATVAVGVYRHSRRAGLGLAQTFTAMDDAIASQFDLDRFVTAQLVELDGTCGRLRWLNAGHPLPLLARGGKMIHSLACEPTLPIGLGGEVAEIAEVDLEPEDQVLLFTDGVPEARDPKGEFFGELRLADLVTRAVAAGLPGPETARRLTHAIVDHHQGDSLRDDATIVLLEWKGRNPTSVL